MLIHFEHKNEVKVLLFAQLFGSLRINAVNFLIARAGS